jgi:oligopeptide/dipeptide ABC transporter ATP-binding protein
VSALTQIDVSESAHDVAATVAPLLLVDNLQTWFFTRDGLVRAVDGLSYHLKVGETLGIVGESGCGKSVGALSILGLQPMPPGRIVGGSILFRGRELVGLAEAVMRKIRGNQISFIFQEPMTSLNPVMRVGRQIAEPLMLHQGLGRRAAYDRAAQMLELVRIPDARLRLGDYPHQLSGGTRQRIMIAIALACRPDILIADEPTTALDVTIQAQILRLLRELQRELGTSVILISHNLAVIAESVQRVIVMYAGRKVEEAPVSALFRRPRHPYTVGLLGSVPRVKRGPTPAQRGRLAEIPGMLPALTEPIAGCAFAPRCSLATDKCRAARPPLVEHAAGHHAACWHSERATEVVYG